MAKLVWRVKLVTELEAGETTEVEVARLERDEQAGLADLGLRLAEAKQLMAAIQAEIVPAQVTVAGEHRRTCVSCEGELASKGHYTSLSVLSLATWRSSWTHRISLRSTPGIATNADPSCSAFTANRTLWAGI